MIVLVRSGAVAGVGTVDELREVGLRAFRRPDAEFRAFVSRKFLLWDQKLAGR